MIRILLRAVCCLLFIASGLRAQPLPPLIPYTDGHKWGYADTSGRIVIAPQWDEARFFHGDRAEVLIRPASHRPWPEVHCIIDRKGHYIVAPAAGWSGLWRGWAKTPLNAVDSAGRAGMVDTAGNLLLPYAWDGSGYEVPGPQRDSFKVVYKGGRAGIINRRGDVVVPAVWRFIMFSADLLRLGVAMMTDTGSVNTNNNNGLIDMQNRIILPPRYQEISLVTRPDEKPRLHVTTQVYDTTIRRFTSRRQTLDLIDGSFVPVADSATAEGDGWYELPQPGGYILFNKGNGLGLMNSARRVVIPCCVWRVTADSILLYKDEAVGEDSTIRTISYLDAKTLRPLRMPKTIVLYREQQQRHINEGDYYYPPHPHYPDPATIVLPEAYQVRQFYKDSMLYVVQGYATDGHGGRLYIVEGNIHTGKRDPRRTGYTAVIDSNLDYVVPPIAGYRITAWDAATGIATAAGYSTRYREEGNMLLDKQGRELTRPQTSTDLGGGFRWRGKVYAKAVVQERETGNSELEGGLYVTSVTIIDTDGKALPALARYKIALPGEYKDVLDRLPEGCIAVRDSGGRVGFVTPDGNVALRRFSFRYTYLKAVGNDWLFAKRRNDKSGALLDASGLAILKRTPVYNVEQAQTMRQPVGELSQDHLVVVPRLYKILAQGRDGKPFSFYLDNKRRAYCKGVE